MNNKTAFNAEEYNKKITATVPYYNEFYEQIIQTVKLLSINGIYWLDVGCGTGTMAKYALDNLDIKRMVLCDISSDMLVLAKESFKNHTLTEFLNLSSVDLTYENEFNVVTAVLVNHYLPPKEKFKAIFNCYNALKKGGIMITFDNFAPNGAFSEMLYLNKWKEYQIRCGKSNTDAQSHIERYKRDYYPIKLFEHIELYKNAGFRETEILWLSNMQAGFLCLK